MRLFFLAALPLAALLTATGCGKTECQKYAEMEWKCGDYPAKEESITKQMAEGMCEGAKDCEDDKFRNRQALPGRGGVREAAPQRLQGLQGLHRRRTVLSYANHRRYMP